MSGGSCSSRVYWGAPQAAVAPRPAHPNITAKSAVATRAMLTCASSHIDSSLVLPVCDSATPLRLTGSCKDPYHRQRTSRVGRASPRRPPPVSPLDRDNLYRPGYALQSDRTRAETGTRSRMLNGPQTGEDLSAGGEAADASGSRALLVPRSPLCASMLRLHVSRFGPGAKP